MTENTRMWDKTRPGRMNSSSQSRTKAAKAADFAARQAAAKAKKDAAAAKTPPVAPAQVNKSPIRETQVVDKGPNVGEETVTTATPIDRTVAQVQAANANTPLILRGNDPSKRSMQQEMPPPNSPVAAESTLTQARGGTGVDLRGAAQTPVFSAAGKERLVGPSAENQAAAAAMSGMDAYAPPPQQAPQNAYAGDEYAPPKRVGFVGGLINDQKRMAKEQFAFAKDAVGNVRDGNFGALKDQFLPEQRAPTQVQLDAVTNVGKAENPASIFSQFPGDGPRQPFGVGDPMNRAQPPEYYDRDNKAVSKFDIGLDKPTTAADVQNYLRGQSPQNNGASEPLVNTPTAEYSAEVAQSEGPPEEQPFAPNGGIRFDGGDGTAKKPLSFTQTGPIDYGSTRSDGSGIVPNQKQNSMDILRGQGMQKFGPRESTLGRQALGLPPQRGPRRGVNLGGGTTSGQQWGRNPDGTIKGGSFSQRGQRQQQRAFERSIRNLGGGLRQEAIATQQKAVSDARSDQTAQQRIQADMLRTQMTNQTTERGQDKRYDASLRGTDSLDRYRQDSVASDNAYRQAQIDQKYQELGAGQEKERRELVGEAYETNVEDIALGYTQGMEEEDATAYAATVRAAARRNQQSGASTPREAAQEAQRSVAEGVFLTDLSQLAGFNFRSMEDLQGGEGKDLAFEAKNHKTGEYKRIQLNDYRFWAGALREGPGDAFSRWWTDDTEFKIPGTNGKTVGTAELKRALRAMDRDTLERTFAPRKNR